MLPFYAGLFPFVPLETGVVRARSLIPIGKAGSGFFRPREEVAEAKEIVKELYTKGTSSSERPKCTPDKEYTACGEKIDRIVNGSYRDHWSTKIIWPWQT